MRTTMDLPEDLLEEAKSLSGSKMIRIDNIQRLYIMLFKEVQVMKTGTVNISFQEGLLRQIDETAREESRSRSELIREAARMYIERKKRWKDIFVFGEKQARRLRLSERDVASEIRAYRRSKRGR
jgi:metal-responsive CopG/Arc/MetJ family transcriptional regulator